MKKGWAYTELKKVVSIIIVNFNMFDNKDYHSCFQLADKTKNLLLTDVAEIHILELTKLPEQAKKVVPKPEEQWLHFINRVHLVK